MALLEVSELRKTYRQGEETVEALRGVSLSVERGELLCIVGPSGSGKSTLLHLAGGLDRPTSGSIRLDGQALERFSDAEISRLRRRRLGFVFQFFNLVPSLTALENVALPLMLDGEGLGATQGKARELLEAMGLGSRVRHRPDQLSGGEMQRVAIARALVADPLLVLADEPTGNLDSKSGQQVLELLSQAVRSRGQTLVMVTHDAKATAFASRVIEVRDGRIESDARRECPVSSS